MIKIFINPFLSLKITDLTECFINIVDFVSDNHLKLIVAPLGTKHRSELVDFFRFYPIFIFHG